MKVESNVKISCVDGNVKVSFSDKRFACESIINLLAPALYEIGDKSIEEVNEDFVAEFTIKVIHDENGYGISLDRMDKMNKKVAMYVSIILANLLEE